jgi:hypothetical protein
MPARAGRDAARESTGVFRDQWKEWLNSRNPGRKVLWSRMIKPR